MTFVDSVFKSGHGAKFLQSVLDHPEIASDIEAFPHLLQQAKILDIHFVPSSMGKEDWRPSFSIQVKDRQFIQQGLSLPFFSVCPGSGNLVHMLCLEHGRSLQKLSSGSESLKHAGSSVRKSAVVSGPDLPTIYQSVDRFVTHNCPQVEETRLRLHNEVFGQLHPWQFEQRRISALRAAALEQFFEILSNFEELGTQHFRDLLDQFQVHSVMSS
jgi:hypothetical protein